MNPKRENLGIVTGKESRKRDRRKLDRNRLIIRINFFAFFTRVDEEKEEPIKLFRFEYQVVVFPWNRRDE
jgi:hypothetical protein